MSRFGNLSIRRKLLLMTLASSAGALVLASAGFLTWDVLQYRTEIGNDALAQARLIAAARFVSLRGFQPAERMLED